MIVPAMTNGSMKSIISIPTISAYATNKAITVKPAEEIAKPFVIALAVLPAASNLSALAMTSSPSPDCSAMPLALSTIGP